MGVKVSAHEMLKAGVAVDALSTEWSPCRSDADKQAEYADQASRKRLGEAVAKVFKEETQKPKAKAKKQKVAA